jgi:porin
LGSYYGNLGGDYASAQSETGLGYPTYEWVLELGYVAHITPWLYITPDIQWVINPGGTGDIPNALVIGWELGVTF